jgi:hypothetical protein
MQPRGSDDALQSIYEQELEYFRTATDYREVTVAAAMDYCAKWRISPPEWLAAEASVLLIKLLKSQKATKRGRGGNLIARYRQHLCDLNRWDAVVRIREIRAKSADVMASIRKCRKPDAIESHIAFEKKRRAWLKRGTLECAAIYAAQCEPRVGIEAIKASYRRIERKNADPEQYRSCVFEDDFLHKLGLPGLADPKPWRSLYDLS